MPRRLFEEESVRSRNHERGFEQTIRVKTATMLGALGLGLGLLSSIQANPVASVGNMTAPIAEHTATLLPDGMVLITDGHTNYHTGGGLPFAELFDPMTRTWTKTAFPMFARVNHTA